MRTKIPGGALWRRRGGQSRPRGLMTIAQAAQAMQQGELTPSQLLQTCLQRREEIRGLNCFVTETEAQAPPPPPPSSTGEEPSSSSSSTSLLRGIPVAIKDNFCTAGMPTTASSRMLGNFVAPYTATCVSRLEAAGAVSIGKTNMDEFGMGSGTLYSHVGETISPWSPPDSSIRLVPGGSSGGSAAAVAAGACFAALGSDTGGSVRQPAAYCGVVGLKPTYGRLSRHGLIAFASSLDCPGVLARSVEDCAVVLDAMAGPDPRDSTCLQVPPPPEGFLVTIQKWASQSLQGVKVGIPVEFNVEELDAEVRSVWDEGARMLVEAGAEVSTVSLPSIPLALPAYFVIACAEASSNLARYDGLRYGHRADLSSINVTNQADAAALHRFYTVNRTEGFGDEVKRRILTGCYVLSAKAYAAYYERALAARAKLREEFRAVMDTVDALLTPTTPTGPFASESPAEPAAILLNDIMTIPVNLVGAPAISVPVDVKPAPIAARGGGGGGGPETVVPLPLGLQVIGRPLEEGQVLRVAHALEKAAGFTSKVPTYVFQGPR